MLYGLKSITRTITIITPIALASILIALFSVHDEISIEKFCPFFGFNFRNTFLTGLLNIFSLYMITYYYFMSPLLNNNSDFKKISIISYIISWFLLFLTVIAISTVFPINDSIEPLNSFYLLTRDVELGDFFQRVDAIFILLLLTSIFSYLSINIFMINRIIQKLTNITHQEMISLPIISIFLGLCLLPFDIEINRFIEDKIYRYLIIITTFIVCPIILVLANLKFKFKKGSSNTK